MLVPRIPPSNDNVTGNLTVKKLQSNASQSTAPSKIIHPRLPSSFEVPDYPLEHFSRCLNIASRQILVKNPTHILPFELSYSTNYPQEISKKKWTYRLQEYLNWIRHALSANGEPDYSFIMLRQHQKSTRMLGYAYMKMNAETYLNTLPCKHKTYSVPPLNPNYDLSAWYGEKRKKMTRNQRKRHKEDLEKHKKQFISKNPHIITQEMELNICGNT